MVSSADLTASTVEVFNALSHPARLEILEILRDGEACVCHIQAMLEQRQAYVSQHLNVLRQAGLVTSRKDGLRVYYQISDPGFYAVIDGVREILRAARKLLPTNRTDYNQRKIACTCPQCAGEASCQPSNLVEMSHERIS